MKFSTISLLSILAAVLTVASCQGSGNTFNSHELELINTDSPVMRVLTVDNLEDLVILRTSCTVFSSKDVLSETYGRLAERLIATVTSPEQDGVGIAGPQVGLSRRVVAVQRFDKDGEPFEVYPNIRITALRGEKELGAEGCLSVPGKRGEVARWQDIDIAYMSPSTGKDTTESIQGFTAVIFQHECDHLDGILYTDKAESITEE